MSNEIYTAIGKVISELPTIGKDRTNKQQGFKYRGVEDVMNTFQPLFAKYNIFVVPEVIDQKREERSTKSGGNLIYSILKVKYTFYAIDGSSVSAVVIGEGMDNADKASNKAMSVAFKYACFQVFCIPTEEMIDPDSETPEQSTKKYTCAICGKEITKAIAEGSRAKYGEALCGKECLEKYNEMKGGNENG